MVEADGRSAEAALRAAFVVLGRSLTLALDVIQAPMVLTVVFEHWHLGDGNYPAFAVGDEARLSFELDASVVEAVGDDVVESVRQLSDAEYEVVGRVIRRYPDGASSTFPVVEAGWLRFYCPAGGAPGLAVGTKARLRGQLALDHYQWVESLGHYPDPPDLFYGVRVTRVREVRIPDGFVQRSAGSLAHPTTVAPGEYAPGDVREVAAVGEEGGDPAFSLLDLELLPPGAGPARPTFIGA